MIRLFLDANIYVDLYSSKAVNKLLKPLIDIAGSVIVTEQVVSEVQRNKLNSAIKIIKEESDRFAINSLPDALIEKAIHSDEAEARKRSQDINKRLKDLREELSEIYESAIKSVSEGSDKISIELNKIFSAALRATDAEISFSKKRKELGNPPGKKSDYLGDGLNWEQLLNHSKATGDVIWVVSRDGDYWSKSPDGTLFLNAFLVKELTERKILRMRVFDNLSDALKAFKGEVAKTLSLPSEEELNSAKTVQITNSTPTRTKSDCCEAPTMKIVPNGRYDIYMCGNCGIRYGIYPADCDD
jgi:hypothetical protein